ncbi:hypothetical protein H7097_02270 [Aeromicrobium sp.]|nr:hypothetical protein [Candidatus Saccharibacteria bacterium]
MSAATDPSTTSSSTSASTSLIDKLTAKFNLNKADVQAVVDQDRQDRHAQMEADQKAKLAAAVTDGKLTQAQADHISQVMSEIKTLRPDTDPKSVSDTVRAQIKTKLDDLKTWATTNKVDMQYIMGGHGGHGLGGVRDGGNPNEAN